MKKIIFTFLLALVTALAVNAQSLTGKQWCTVLNDEDGEGIAVALTFEKNGSCEMLIAAQQDMKEDGVPITMIAAVTVPGTYKLDGKDLNNQFNNGKAKVDVDYEIKGMDAKTKALLNKQIKGELNTLRAEFKKGLLVVVLHNVCGLAAGYLIGSLLRLTPAKRRAISVEVGMQNSGLASSLATLHFAAYPLATIPGALFSVWHNISGAIVAKLYSRNA